jgi:hypothetical protein
VLPGLLAVAAGLAVERWDRRKLGLSPPGVAGTLWDNKLWLLASVPVSLVAVLLYDQVADTNLIDAAEVKHLVRLVAVTGVAGAGASAIRVVLHRRKVPRINAGSFERDVLSAAARAGGTVRRVAYQADDDHVGVFVHRDRDALVLSPSIYFSRPDPLTEITDTTPLEEADDKATATFDGRYADDKEGEITRPTAVLAENAKSATPRNLLQYRDVP